MTDQQKRLKHPSYKSILLFLLFLIIALLFFYNITYLTFRETIRESIQDSINLKRMRNYEDFLINISDLESSQRGYLITGDREFIKTTDEEIKKCRNSIAELATLDNNDTVYQQQFKKLKEVAEAKINYILTQIKLVNEGKDSVAIANVRLLKGYQLMNAVKDQIDLMEANGREVLRRSANEKKVIAEKANQRFVILGIIALLAFAYFFFRIRYDLHKRLEAENKLANYNEELSREVEEKTKAIKDRESMYRSLIELAADGIFISDSNFRYKDVNTSACRMLGYTKEEILKMSVAELTIREENEIPLRFTELLQGKSVLQERKLRKKDGELLPVEISAQMLPNGDFLATVRDITERKDREHRQKIREKQLHLFVENSPVAMAMFDTGMNYIAVSKKWIADNHLENQDIIGKNHYEFVPEIPERWKEVHQRCLAGSSEKNELDFLLHPDGTIDWLHWEVTPWYTEEEKIGGIFMYIEPLNEKLKMEASLREKEQQYSLLIDRLTDGFIWLDENWVYKYANKTIGQMANMNPAALVGKNIWELFPEMIGSDTYKLMQEVMQNRIYGYNTVYFHELDRWQENHVYPAGDGIYMFVRDVTETKKAEQKLAESEKNLRQVLSGASESFYVVDRNYRITLISDFAIENMKKAWHTQVVLGDNLFSLIPPETTEPIRVSLEKAFTGEIVTYEINRKYEGLPPWVEVNYRPIRDDQGNVVSVYIATKDITLRKLAEEEIIKEKQLSDSIINSLPGIFYLYDEEGRFIRWNKNFEIITGYTTEEMKLCHPLDFFEGHEKELLKYKIQEVFEKGRSEVEADFVTKDKQKIPYYFNGWRVFFEGKTCLIGVGIDITERKKVEKEILLANQQFKLISRATNDFVWDSDLEKGTTWWNDNFYKELGWNKDEVKQSGNFWEENLHPADKKRVVDKVNSVLYSTNKSVWTEEYRFKKKNGKFITVLDRGYILRHPNGKPYRMLGSMTDISSLKEVEAELRSSEQKYKTLFHSNPMPLWMYSLEDLRFIDVNDSAILHYGYSREEFLNMTILDIRTPEERQRLADNLSKKYGRGIVSAGLWKHVKKDGTIITVDVYSHDTNYDGKLVRLVLAIDVTEKVLAEQALEKSNEDIRRLAKHLEEVREEERTGIAREIHDELGQQLTVLKMDVSWLLKKMSHQDQKVDERLKEMLQVIDDTVKTIRRISSELRPSVLDNLGIIAALEWQCGEFENRTGIKTVFHTDTLSLPLPIKTANGVFRIFQESLTNVARHAQATEVQVNLLVQNNQIHLKIQDNGKGFDLKKVAQKKTLGILGMKERTLLMQGECIISSKPEMGTLIELIIPLNITID